MGYIFYTNIWMLRLILHRSPNVCTYVARAGEERGEVWIEVEVGRVGMAGCVGKVEGHIRLYY